MNLNGQTLYTSSSSLSYLARTNKEKGHKPKPSLSSEEWEKEQARRDLKKSSKPIANEFLPSKLMKKISRRGCGVAG